MRASIVSGADAAPVFEAAEHDLDLVAAAVEEGVVRDRHLAVGFRGAAGGDAAIGQRPVDRSQRIQRCGAVLRSAITAVLAAMAPLTETHRAYESRSRPAQRHRTLRPHSVYVGAIIRARRRSRSACAAVHPATLAPLHRWRLAGSSHPGLRMAARCRPHPQQGGGRRVRWRLLHVREAP